MKFMLKTFVKSNIEYYKQLGIYLKYYYSCNSIWYSEWQKAYESS